MSPDRSGPGRPTRSGDEGEYALFLKGMNSLGPAEHPQQTMLHCYVHLQHARAVRTRGNIRGLFFTSRTELLAPIYCWEELARSHGCHPVQVCEGDELCRRVSRRAAAWHKDNQHQISGTKIVVLTPSASPGLFGTKDSNAISA